MSTGPHACMHARATSAAQFGSGKCFAFRDHETRFISTCFYISQVAENTQACSHYIDLLCRHPSSQKSNPFFLISTSFSFCWSFVMIDLMQLAGSTPVAQPWPRFKISVKFRRNFGIFFVFGSYREVEFR